MDIKINDNKDLLLTLLELRDFYELFYEFFHSYGRYPRCNEWHNLYMIKILEKWSSNDFTNLPKDLFSEIDFKQRIKSIQIKSYELLTNKIPYIYEIVKGYDNYRFKIDNTYIKYLAIKSLLLSLSIFNTTNSYGSFNSFNSLLEYKLRKEIDENPGYFGEDNFYRTISSLLELRGSSDLIGLDRISFKYSPALISLDKSKYEDLLNSYAENESYYISSTLKEENNTCKSIMDESDFILSSLTDKERYLLICRYGQNKQKMKSFKEIKDELNYKSYFDILVNLNYSFWRLKTSWPGDFLCDYFFNIKYNHNGIKFNKQIY